MKQQTNWRQFSVLVSVFFFWGFVASGNDILMSVFKDKLQLKQWQSQMINVAFYVAYTVGSLIYYTISKIRGEDILNRIGYRNGIAWGLSLSAFGTLLFYPAAQYASFGLMITGLFIVALGFSLQQTAANPLAIVMGDPAKGATRLSLAGGVNNIGSTIAPLIISYAIFGAVGGTQKFGSFDAVKMPYLILGGAFLLAALIFRISSVPNHIALSKEEPAALGSAGVPAADRRSAFNYSQLWLGMIAIFLYVGVEVSTAGNLPLFLKQHTAIGGLPEDQQGRLIAPFISLYWASLMIGRWAASVNAFGAKGTAKTALRIFVPFLAFGLFLLVNKIAGYDVSPFFVYTPVIILMMICEALSKGNPAKQLLIFSFMGMAALVTGIFSDKLVGVIAAVSDVLNLDLSVVRPGYVSAFAFTSVGLFCSTLWPCIFTLAIAGLGRHTNEGSSLLIMMIMGGGIVSLLQGLLADVPAIGIQYSYVVGVACFLYLAFYAVRAKGILKRQGIDYDVPVAG